MAQFYDDKRTMMITGRGGRRQVTVDKKRLFGIRGNGKVNPPPYSVQIEVSSRDPQRIANQNQMFMEAYTMSAQAQQFFPLSALFRILNLDGKDKILPVIEENETYQEQMQQMQQQLEEMQMQMQQLQAENENLSRTANQATNTLAGMSARRGGAVTPDATKVAEAGGGQDTANAVVNASRNTLGVPTGAALPA
jgi:hypothetical protein